VYSKKEAKNTNSSDKTKEVLRRTINSRDHRIKPDRVIRIRNIGILTESTTKEIENLIDNDKLKEAGLEAR
jgi:hypothetical protein